ncbi:hypothetical protein LEP1GSC188_0009, partial [Leptospira weilii serovar Topaz str. LT2116]
MIVSGNPFNPSTQAIKISSTPDSLNRLRSVARTWLLQSSPPNPKYLL